LQEGRSDSPIQPVIQRLTFTNPTATVLSILVDYAVEYARCLTLVFGRCFACMEDFTCLSRLLRQYILADDICHACEHCCGGHHYPPSSCRRLLAAVQQVRVLQAQAVLTSVSALWLGRCTDRICTFAVAKGRTGYMIAVADHARL